MFCRLISDVVCEKQTIPRVHYGKLARMRIRFIGCGAIIIQTINSFKGGPDPTLKSGKKMSS